VNDHDLLQRLDNGMGADADVMPDHVFDSVISALPNVRQHRRQWSGIALFAAAVGGAAIAAAVTAIVLITSLPGGLEVGPPDPSRPGDELVVVIRSPQGADLALATLATLATGGVSALTTMPGDELEPAWAPDGATVAFTNDGDLYTVDVASGAVTQLTATPQLDEAGPAFSPAGDRIAFSTDAGSTRTIWTMPSEGGDPHSVTEFDAPFACCPRWSSDGSSVAVAVDRSSGGQIDIYLVDVGSGLQTQLTDTPGDDGSHEWSPDGELIAFQADQEFGLVVMRTDGTDRNVLTRVSDTGFGITWSPDSTRIAFVSVGTVRVIGADGSGEGELLDIPGSVIEDVAWRP